MAFLHEAAAHVAQWEGFIAHVYLDTVGVPTIAYGYNLNYDNHQNHVSLVTGWDLNQLAIDIDSCKAFAAEIGHHNIIARAYANHTQLRLTQAQGQDLLATTLQAFITRLESKGFDLISIPKPAALAIIDMAYNLGTNGMIRKFRRFTAHIRRGDWAAAATESKRRGVSDARNQATAELLRNA